ncbi:MAG: hypothetical protein Q8R92_16675 [Deltaproteobacteria bacterium]|nr:hypothetical protein [Deltaproteobacteria bacterium]
MACSPSGQAYNELYYSALTGYGWRYVQPCADGSFSATVIPKSQYAAYNITPESVTSYMQSQNYSLADQQKVLSALFGTTTVPPGTLPPATQPPVGSAPPTSEFGFVTNFVQEHPFITMGVVGTVVYFLVVKSKPFGFGNR